jgi:hypothetical protein
MFAVTQELLLMFPREKAGAYRLVCDLQSEIDLLFQSLRSDTSHLEDEAKLQDMQLQHAALSSSLAACIAEKIALEQLLHKEREQALSNQRIAVSQAEATDSAALENAALLRKLSAAEDQLAAAEEARALSERESQQQIRALGETIGRMKVSHEGECEALRRQIGMQKDVIESAQIVDVQRAAIEVEHHQEVASLMTARAEHVKRSSRKWLLVRRAHNMFRWVFGRWKAALLRNKSVRNAFSSRLRRSHIRGLQTAFFRWRVLSGQKALQGTHSKLFRKHVADICAICESVASRLTQSTGVTNLDLQFTLQSVLDVRALANLMQEACALDRQQPRALLPEVELVSVSLDSDAEESQALGRMISKLSDVTQKLLESRSECDQLHEELARACADQDVVRSQQSILREEFQASLHALANKAVRSQQQIKAAVEGVLKCIGPVMADSSHDVAAEAVAAALESLVDSDLVQGVGDGSISLQLQAAIANVKTCLQNHAGQLSRAFEENKFITHRLQTLCQPDGLESELAGLSEAPPTALQCVSVIEREIAALKLRIERLREDAAVTAGELTRKLAAESEISSSYAEKLQQIGVAESEVILPLRENIERLQIENSKLASEVAALRSDKQALEAETTSYTMQIFELKAKVASTCDSIEEMQGAVLEHMQDVPSIKAELDAAYASSQRHMVQCEVQKLQIDALQMKLDSAAAEHSRVVSQFTEERHESMSSNQQKLDALQKKLDSAAAEHSRVVSQFTEELHESMSSNQQKLVSLAAHSELQDGRIANAEQQLQHKIEELGEALGRVAALEVACAKLSDENETLVKWKAETEAWGAQAIAAVESKSGLVKGENMYIYVFFATAKFYRCMLMQRVFEPAANPSHAELNAKISKMQADERELKSQLDQQSQAYAALSEKMHFAVQEHERKMQEKDDAAQAALEETLSEIEVLTQQLVEAQALLLQKGSDIDSMKVTRSIRLLFCKPFLILQIYSRAFPSQFPPFVSSVSA